MTLYDHQEYPYERLRLSPEMTLRIEKALGVSTDTLLCMQDIYDIARARVRLGEINFVPFESNVRTTNLAAQWLPYNEVGFAETLVLDLDAVTAECRPERT